MAVVERVKRTRENGRQTELVEESSMEHVERFDPWPVNWSGVATGALGSIAGVVILGLIGVAVGAHLTGPENRVVDLHEVTLVTLAYSVFSAFLACAAGGWIAARVAGAYQNETAMLHGAIRWLVAVPLLITLASLGAGSYMGGWHGSLAGQPAWTDATATPFEAPQPLPANATEQQSIEHAAALTEYRQKTQQWREETPRATRNGALGGMMALLMGLVGSVIGGWIGSGEPMTFSYNRTRFMRRFAD